jgi:hypothetical protein
MLLAQDLQVSAFFSLWEWLMLTTIFLSLLAAAGPNGTDWAAYTEQRCTAQRCTAQRCTAHAASVAHELRIKILKLYLHNFHGRKTR